MLRVRNLLLLCLVFLCGCSFGIDPIARHDFENNLNDSGLAQASKFVYHGLPKFAYAFSDHMVLQRGTDITVWGFAEPGERVAVTINTQSVSAVADGYGKWLLQLDSMSAGGPYCLRLKSGETNIELKDVMVGDVWLCLGQSNMRYGLGINRIPGNFTFADELSEISKQATFPIRHAMRKDDALDWLEVNYRNVTDNKANPNGVTAVGYFFAKHLRASLGNVPIGIVQVGNGGAAIREFLPKDFQMSNPKMRKMLENYMPAYIEKYGIEKINNHDAVVSAYIKEGDYYSACSSYISRYPGHLFTRHIFQLKKLNFKGMVYYQGESDAGRGQFYRELLSEMIDVFRDFFEFKDMPFLCIILPPAVKINYSDIVESQLVVADNKEGVYAVFAPEGAWDDPKDLHAPYKEIVGKRTALTALAEVYGKGNAYLGPRYASHERVNDKLRVTFKGTAGGLKLANGKTVLTGFQLSGANGNFVDAAAQLVSNPNVVEVTIPESLQNEPNLYIRYNWKAYYEPVLYGENDLPAVFFRTDNFDLRTTGHY